MINLITLSRVPLAVLTLVFFDSPLKFVFFGLGIATDFFDGFLARKLGRETKFGAMLDPAIDKVFVLILLVGFVILRGLPLWFVAVLFFRDIGLLLELAFLKIRTPLKKQNPIIFKARMLGKIVTVLQFFAFFVLLAGWPVPLIPLGVLIFFVSLLCILDYWVAFTK